MALPDSLFPPTWLYPSVLLLVMLIGAAGYSAPWGYLRERRLVNTFLVACTVLLMLWRLKAGFDGGLGLHFLGLTALTLMFGWQFALLGAVLISVVLTAFGLGGWQSLALNILIDGAVPVLFSYTFFRLVDRYLPNHFFIYIFIAAFLGGALAISLRLLALGAAAVIGGGLPVAEIGNSISTLILLLGLPEGLLNGMAMTIFVVYRPAWVMTFDDTRYIHGK